MLCEFYLHTENLMSKPIVGEWIQIVVAKKEWITGKIDTFVWEIVDPQIGNFILPEWTSRILCKDWTNAELIITFNDYQDLHEIFNEYTENWGNRKWLEVFYKIANAAAKTWWKMIVHQQTTGSFVLEWEEEIQIDVYRLREDTFYDKFIKKIEEEGLIESFNGLVIRFWLIAVNQAIKDIAISMFEENTSADIPDIYKIMKN